MSDDHEVLVDCSLVVGVVDDVALDDSGLDSDILVDGALDVLVDGGLVVDIVDHVQDNIDDHNVLVVGSLVAGVVDNIAQDDSGVDGDIQVDGTFDVIVIGSLVVGVVNHILDVVVNVALDTLGINDGRGHNVLVDNSLIVDIVVNGFQ